MLLKRNKLIFKIGLAVSLLIFFSVIYLLKISNTKEVLNTQELVFKIQIFEPPRGFKPHGIRSSSGQYLYQQLACPLLKLNSMNQLEPYLAKECKYIKPNQVTCVLFDNLAWSDGTPITAYDYELSLKDYISPSSSFFRQDLLYEIKNARKIQSGNAHTSTLGVKALDSKTLHFDLEEPNKEFLFILANPILSLYRENLSCGLYKIETSNDSSVVLSPRPFWHLAKTQSSRPKLQFKVYREDNLGLKAYEAGQLDLLKRVPTALIPKLQPRPDYVTLNVLRMDAIFIHHHYKNLLEIAPLLQSGIDYSEWQKLYHAKYQPGCFGLPLIDGTITPICIKSTELNPNSKIASLHSNPEVTLFYSKSGGIDHDRAMQFIAQQWKINRGITTKLEPLENTYFQSQIKDGKLGLYRRGFSLERPTCLAALENFTSDHEQNHIHFQNKEFDELTYQMKTAYGNQDRYQQLCQKAARLLLDHGEMIPTGPIYFSFLINPRWKGWSFNSLNHLDLSRLHFEN